MTSSSRGSIVLQRGQLRLLRPLTVLMDLDPGTMDILRFCSSSFFELREIIVVYKKLQLCIDFEFHITDTENGKDLDDEGIHLMEGSRVVSMHVPVGLSGSRDLNVRNVARNNVGNVKTVAHQSKAQICVRHMYTLLEPTEAFIHLETIKPKA